MLCVAGSSLLSHYSVSSVSEVINEILFKNSFDILFTLLLGPLNILDSDWTFSELYVYVCSYSSMSMVEEREPMVQLMVFIMVKM